MKNILVLNSSLQGENGNSSKLTDAFITKWRETETVDVLNIDLHDLNLPHLSAQEMETWGMKSDEMSAEQTKLASYSNDLIAQLERSDIIVIGIPMYNFTIPSSFKAWIDRVARAGRTFSYTEQGPKGHLTNKSVYVMAARGGVYQDTPNDIQTPYLKLLFGFLGITDVNFVYLEGLAMGEEQAKNAWNDAHKRIAELLPSKGA